MHWDNKVCNRNVGRVSFLLPCTPSGDESEDHHNKEELQYLQDSVQNVLEEVSLLKNMTMQGTSQLSFSAIQTLFNDCLSLLRASCAPADSFQ